MLDFFSKLFENKTAEFQNVFLINYIVPFTPRVCRPRENNPRPCISIQYCIRKVNGELVIICAQSFQSITQIKRKRLERIANHFFNTGHNLPEQRDGSRLKDSDTNQTESISNTLNHCSVARVITEGIKASGHI